MHQPAPLASAPGVTHCSAQEVKHSRVVAGRCRPPHWGSQDHEASVKKGHGNRRGTEANERVFSRQLSQGWSHLVLCPTPPLVLTPCQARSADPAQGPQPFPYIDKVGGLLKPHNKLGGSHNTYVLS